MTVTSLGFFAFFGCSLLIYYLIPKRLQWTALLLFSMLFYFLAALPQTILYMWGTTAVTWGCARQIRKAQEANNGAGAKRALLGGIVFSVGLLTVLKYNGFLINNLNRIPSVTIPHPDWATPLGISFYTFTALGYLIDVYWEQAVFQNNLAKTALFIGYYPALISGPITRSREVASQLYAGHDFDLDRLALGVQRMLWGLFLKLVVSSRLAVVPNTIYDNPELYLGLFVWFAAGVFTLQLYTDFMGCMEIILGVSECYGIQLPENFRTPFFSGTVQEFWQRWHITLGAWMRDYILYPLLRTELWRRMGGRIKARFGKKASKQLPAWTGMLCVWLLMGLWHGGAWKYILGMGLWFFGCIILEQLLEPLFKKINLLLGVNTSCFSHRLFQSAKILVLVSIGNMFFRLDSLEDALRTIRRGFQINRILKSDDIVALFGGKNDYSIAVVGLAILLFVSIMQQQTSMRKWLAGQNLVFRWAVWILLLFTVLLAGTWGPGYNAQEFIYERF